MPYQPYPIYDPSKGLVLAKEPWIAPMDAFRVVENARIYQGRILKRRGYDLFGELGTREEAHEMVDSGHATGDKYQSASHPGSPAESPEYDDLEYPVLAPGVSPNLYTITITAGGSVNTLDTSPRETGGTTYGFTNVSGASLVGESEIDIADGSWYLDYDGNIANGTAITIDYEYNRGLPVTGLWSFFTKSGNETLCAWDTKRMWTWNATQLRFIPLEHDEGDLFSDADAENFIWGATLETDGEEVLAICNGADTPVKFNGTAIEDMDLEYQSSPSESVESCLFIANYKAYTLYIHTTEAGSRYPQRIRWSNVAEPETLSLTNFADAPTEDWIVSYARLKDKLVVFFERSTWEFRFTDDFRAPFEWVLIGDTDGSMAPLSTVDFSNELVTLGPTSLVTTNGDEVDQLGADIPDFVLDIEPTLVAYSYGVVIEEDREAWISYVPSGGTQSSKIIGFNYETSHFFKHDMPFHCYGFFQRASTLTWDEVTGTWDSIDWAPDERSLLSGFPTTLAGSYDSKVYEIPSSNWNDDGAAIAMRVRSQGLNPYLRQDVPMLARLGYLQIFCDAVPDTTLTVRFFKNWQDNAWKEVTVDLDIPASGDAKIWLYIPVYETAHQHRVELYNNSTRKIAIDAIVPYFKPAGPIRKFA